MAKYGQGCEQAGCERDAPPEARHAEERVGPHGEEP